MPLPYVSSGNLVDAVVSKYNSGIKHGYFLCTSSVGGLPTENSYFIDFCTIEGGNDALIKAYRYDGAADYYYKVINKTNGSVIYDWQHVPTRAEVEALSNKVQTYNYTEDSGNFLDWIQSTFTINGEYYVIFASTNIIGWVGNGTGICLVQKRNSDIYLTAYYNETVIASRQTIYLNRYTNNQWLEWNKVPTREEIDAVSNKIVQVTWANTVTFNCTTNHRFVIFAGANTVYSGINYSDRLTFSSINNGTEGITMTATRDGAMITVNLNVSANLGILIF